MASHQATVKMLRAILLSYTQPTDAPAKNLWMALYATLPEVCLLSYRCYHLLLYGAHVQNSFRKLLNEEH